MDTKKIYVVVSGQSGEDVPTADFPTVWGAYTTKKDALKKAREIKNCYKSDDTEIIVGEGGSFIDMTDDVEDSHMVIVVQQTNVDED